MSDFNSGVEVHFEGLAAHVLTGIGTSAGRQAMGAIIRSAVDEASREVELIDQYEKMVASATRPSDGLLQRLNSAYEHKDKLLLKLLNIEVSALGVVGLTYKPGTQYLSVVVADALRLTRESVLESLILQIKDKAPDAEKQKHLDGDFIDNVMALYDAFVNKALETGIAHDQLAAKRLWTYRGTYLAHSTPGRLSDKIAVHLKTSSEDTWTFYEWRGDQRAAVVVEAPEVEHFELAEAGYDVVLVNEQYCLSSADLRQAAVFGHCRSFEMQDFETQFSDFGPTFGCSVA